MLKKLFTGFRLLGLVALILFVAVAATYSAKVYKPTADKMVVASGGILDIQTGGKLVLNADTISTYTSGYVDVGDDSLVTITAISNVDTGDAIFAAIIAHGTTAGYPNASVIRAYCSTTDTIKVKLNVNPADSVKVAVIVLRD